MSAVQIEDYDLDWPRLFEVERSALLDVLSPWLTGGVHHIGSTAVPGLCAKPIIDMMAGIRDLDEARGAVDALTEIGWTAGVHRPAEAHWFYRACAPLGSTHALHLTQVGSALRVERLTFRDALRADGGLRAEYGNLKQRLAAEARDDENRDQVGWPAYTDGKREFVAGVLASHGVFLD